MEEGHRQDERLRERKCEVEWEAEQRNAGAVGHEADALDRHTGIVDGDTQALLGRVDGAERRNQ